LRRRASSENPGTLTKTIKVISIGNKDAFDEYLKPATDLQWDFHFVQL